MPYNAGGAPSILACGTDRKAKPVESESFLCLSHYVSWFFRVDAGSGTVFDEPTDHVGGLEGQRGMPRSPFDGFDPREADDDGALGCDSDGVVPQGKFPQVCLTQLAILWQRICNAFGMHHLQKRKHARIHT